jgi:DNA repair exonuclease SbcCD ATPase subunit
MKELDDIKERLLKAIAKRDVLIDEIRTNETEMAQWEIILLNLEQAKELINVVAQKTQAKMEFHFSDIASVALSSVDPNFPSLEIKFETRRNQSECDIKFKEYGELDDPMESSGGGAKDIASFALRLAYWSLNKNRPVMILDEPFHFVSPDRQEQTSRMLKMISEKLGIQIIMVSHQQDINYAANKTFRVTKKDRISTVVEE